MQTHPIMKTFIMTIVHLSHKKEGKEKQLKLFKARVHLTFCEDALKVKQKFLLLVSISTFCSANISYHFVGTVFLFYFHFQRQRISYYSLKNSKQCQPFSLSLSFFLSYPSAFSLS